MSLSRIFLFPKQAPFPNELVDHSNISFLNETDFKKSLDRLNKQLDVNVVQQHLVLGQHASAPYAEVAFRHYNMQRLDSLSALNEHFSLRVRVPNGKTTRYARLILPNPS